MHGPYMDRKGSEHTHNQFRVCKAVCVHATEWIAWSFSVHNHFCVYKVCVCMPWTVHLAWTFSVYNHYCVSM